MAHLHCIDHGQRVVVVVQTNVTVVERKGKTHEIVTQYDVTLHRNGGKSARRCNSMLGIRERQYTPGMVTGGLSQIRRDHRQGKPQTSSR